MDKSAPPISVYILTFNNEDTLKGCLESVVSHADEVVVIDSGSTDETLNLCRDFKVRLYRQDWAGFRKQYQKAADLTKNKWIMFVDADEIVPELLWKELKTALRRDNGKFDGYVVPRLNFFIDRWIKHGAWGSDKEIRICKRDKGRWEGGLHAKIVVDGPTRNLRTKYLHLPFKGIAEQVTTLNRYSDIAACDLSEQGRHVGGTHAAARSVFRFFKGYILKRGFLDGFPGFYVAAAEAFYALTKYAKLWELGKEPDEKDTHETHI